MVLEELVVKVEKLALLVREEPVEQEVQEVQPQMLAKMPWLLPLEQLLVAEVAEEEPLVQMEEMVEQEIPLIVVEVVEEELVEKPVVQVEIQSLEI